MGRASRRKHDGKVQNAPVLFFTPAATAPPSRFSTAFNYTLMFGLGAVIAITVVLAMNSEKVMARFRSPPKAETGAAAPRSLAELLALSPKQLAKVDIARTNLLCAEGLPGAESLDSPIIDRYLAQLDRWAARVKSETERHLYRLTDPRYKDHAEHYQHSEARFRAEWLVSVLQQDIGVHYHAGFVPQDKPVPPFKTSKEVFVHGLLENEDAHKAFGGNCVSLPVIYAAVGRRLGYPVKLVSAKEHVFCRWAGLDHPNPAWRERFNFDGAGNGFSIDPDEFYLQWPRPSSAWAVEVYEWLKDLSPERELAVFLQARGHVLCHTGHPLDGQVAYVQAVRYSPSSRGPLMSLGKTLEQQLQVHMAAHRGAYDMSLAQQSSSSSRLLDDSFPQPRPGRGSDVLAQVEALNARNQALRVETMMPPMPSRGAQPMAPMMPGQVWPGGSILGPNIPVQP